MNQGRPIRPDLSCLAVLFLLAQLMLAATHVHLAGPQGVHASAAAFNGAAPLPSAPEQPGDQSCPLCWGQAAANTLLAPPATVLSPPTDSIGTPLPPRFDRLAQNAPSNAFQPRAPPAPGCA